MSEDPFYGTSGPKNAKILLVGEAWGEDEDRQKRPFVGTSGWILDKILRDAGIARDSVLCTNVVNARPAANNFGEFLVTNAEHKKHKGQVLNGIYPAERLARGVEDLRKLVDLVRPSLIVAAGNWPLWALSSHCTIKTDKGYKLPGGIAKWRGSQTYTRPDIGTYPLLPIYHPAAIAREWKSRAITVHDLHTRAARYINGQCSWDPPKAEYNHKPNFGEVIDFLHLQITSGSWLSVDIETYAHRWISCVGFAASWGAICIPFFSFDKDGKHVPYWTKEQEVAIWIWIKAALENKQTQIVGQNFAYDTQFFKRWYDINAIVAFDTMVAQHTLWPGTPKDLAYLASMYCEHYCYWKDETDEWNTKEFGAEDLWRYNCKDTINTLEIAMALRAALQSENMEGLFAFQLEQWKLAREMTLRGVNFNMVARREMRSALRVQEQEISAWLMQAVPEGLRLAPSGIPWFSSNTAMSDLFYTRLGFPVKLHKKTKKPTMDDSAIQAIEERFPWTTAMMSRIRQLRSIKVFESHFLDAPTSIDDRIRCQFKITGTETFRWSSSKTAFDEGTNLQNIPKMD